MARTNRYILQRKQALGMGLSPREQAMSDYWDVMDERNRAGRIDAVQFESGQGWKNTVTNTYVSKTSKDAGRAAAGARPAAAAAGGAAQVGDVPVAAGGKGAEKPAPTAGNPPGAGRTFPIYGTGTSGGGGAEGGGWGRGADELRYRAGGWRPADSKTGEEPGAPRDTGSSPATRDIRQGSIRLGDRDYTDVRPEWVDKHRQEIKDWEAARNATPSLSFNPEDELLKKMDSAFAPPNVAGAQSAGLRRDPASEASDIYGLRHDGSVKGEGFFGPLRRPDGSVSTELTVGVMIGGRETEIPSLVPTLDREEISYLLAGKPITPSIVQTAVNHAVGRISAGRSPFAEPGEWSPPPLRSERQRRELASAAAGFGMPFRAGE